MPKSLFVDPAATRAPGRITFEDIPVNVYNKTVAQEIIFDTAAAPVSVIHTSPV